MKRKIIVFFLTLLCLFLGVACNQTTAKATVLATEEDRVVISIDDGEATLVQVLNNLQADGKITFEISGGMLTAINSKENRTETANSGYSWMIYTSNTQLSYAEYGSKTYGDAVCNSAAFGADTLKVRKGETIIISYDFWSF